MSVWGLGGTVHDPARRSSSRNALVSALRSATHGGRAGVKAPLSQYLPSAWAPFPSSSEEDSPEDGDRRLSLERPKTPRFLFRAHRPWLGASTGWLDPDAVPPDAEGACGEHGSPPPGPIPSWALPPVELSPRLLDEEDGVCPVTVEVSLPSGCIRPWEWWAVCPPECPAPPAYVPWGAP